jgi:hypothetical protein
MIQLYAATALQTGFYLPVFTSVFSTVLFGISGQVMKELYENLFNKQAV